MVQDIHDLEFYTSKSGNGMCTKYQNDVLHSSNLDMQMEDDLDVLDKTFQSNIAERQPAFVVPLPFSSHWLSSYIYSHRKIEKSSQNISHKNHCRGGGKRPYIEEEVALGDDNNIKYRTKKASLKSEPVLQSLQADRNISHFSTDWWPSGTMKTDQNQIPIIAKFYPENEFDETFLNTNSTNVKLNDIVQIVGVLSLNLTDVEFKNSKKFSSNEGLDYMSPFQYDFSSTPTPPPSQLPRLQVLYHEVLDLDHIALHSSNSTYRRLLAEPNFPQASDGREQAIHFFSTHIFQGNIVAAESLLMSILSLAERDIKGSKIKDTTTNQSIPFSSNRNRFKTRKIPSGSSIGSLSLNVNIASSSSPKAYQQFLERLQRVLKSILPIVAYVPDLSPSTLNDPKKISIPSKAEVNDFDNPSANTCEDRLCPSPLQLPRGSMLVVNEHNMKEGNLNSNGYAVMNGLASICEKQICEYRFGVSDFPFEADYSVIVVSKGRRSLVPCNAQLSISVEEDKVNDELPEGIVDQVRAYISRCRSPLSVLLPKEVCETMEKSFVDRRVSQRKKGETNLYGEMDFHRWLAIARAQARSQYGAQHQKIQNKEKLLETSIKYDDWCRALTLDDFMMV